MTFAAWESSPDNEQPFVVDCQTYPWKKEVVLFATDKFTQKSYMKKFDEYDLELMSGMTCIDVYKMFLERVNAPREHALNLIRRHLNGDYSVFGMHAGDVALVIEGHCDYDVVMWEKMQLWEDSAEILWKDPEMTFDEWKMRFQLSGSNGIAYKEEIFFAVKEVLRLAKELKG